MLDGILSYRPVARSAQAHSARMSTRDDLKTETFTPLQMLMKKIREASSTLAKTRTQSLRHRAGNRVREPASHHTGSWNWFPMMVANATQNGN
jgi:hypothetical protein